MKQKQLILVAITTCITFKDILITYVFSVEKILKCCIQANFHSTFGREWLSPHPFYRQINWSAGKWSDWLKLSSKSGVELEAETRSLLCGYLTLRQLPMKEDVKTI